MVKKIVDKHSTSLKQPTQIFTFAHSIVKHRPIGRRVASGDREKPTVSGFSVILVGIRYFPVFKIPKSVSVSVFKISDIGSVFRLTDPPLTVTDSILPVFQTQSRQQY